MRTRTYLFCSTKSGGEDFNQFLQNLVDRRITAYENAAWLRYFNNQKNIPIYDQNPYTDVDRLVKRMLGEESLEIEWTVLDIEIIWNSLDIQLTQQGNEYQLNIQNLGSTTRLINDADIRIVAFDEQGESACFQDAERPITISPGKACTLTHQIEDLQGKVLKIQSGNSALCINIM